MCMRAKRMRGPLLGAVIALMTACATPSTRPPTPPSTPALASPAPPSAPSTASPKDSPAADASASLVATLSPWPRLRQRFAMKGCDYRPEVQRWARYYTQNPRLFSTSWKRALPFLLLVTAQIEQHDLPGEFALLPYLESNYQPVASHGDRSAGMWQLVPDTARTAGLVITSEYDGRLDALASTAAALDLIEHYDREFADWRLVDMAFNSGEFRVKKLLAGRDARTLSANELARFAFHPVTHEHLDRLLALACIVTDPERFAVHLPEPDPNDLLQDVTLEAGMDLRLVARLAGIDIDEVRRWNAGYRRNHMPSGGTHHLLLPTTRVAAFRAAADALPVGLWSDWREQRAAHGSGMESATPQVGVSGATLADANTPDRGAPDAPGTNVLLPGRDVASAETEPARQARAHIHIVVAGDTLSHIAQRYSIPLRQLRHLNPQSGATLHLGDRLHLDAEVH